MDLISLTPSPIGHSREMAVGSRAALLFSSVGKPSADAITSATASLTYAGRVPVCAIAFAPSSEHIQEANFQASSLFALALLMAMPVGEPKEEPAATPSRCGTETMPQFMEAVPSLM